MNTFPQLSYVCPIRWNELPGDERERFCEKCGHRVSNLSAMNAAERTALLAKLGRERVCASFYVRLSGEYVTPENPLTPEERSKIRQLGVAALSAGALALAAGCISPSEQTKLNPPPKTTPQVTKTASATDEDILVLQAFGIIAEPSPRKRHR
jgi:hypothetical protein